jgi:hypothetical protein
MRTFPVFTYSWSIFANVSSCHCLQNGHWKSLISTSQTGAVAAPRIRPRSALTLMESVRRESPAYAGATSPEALSTWCAEASGVCAREQPATTREATRAEIKRAEV